MHNQNIVNIEGPSNIHAIIESPNIEQSIINPKPTSKRILDILPLTAMSNNSSNFESPISIQSVSIQNPSSKRIRDMIPDECEPRNSAKRICSSNYVIYDFHRI